MNERTAIKGCAWINGHELVFQEPDLIATLDDIPSPYLNGMLDQFLEAGLLPLFETNRGCPFKCRYCVWGLTDYNKVHLFSLERVFKEMDYVSRKFPNIPAWIIADANFGLLPRDIQIAEKIRQIRKENLTLRTVITWESKNTTQRNLEIARLLVDKQGYVLMAIQTFDETALIEINRKNINSEEMLSHIGTFQQNGTQVVTNILSGLPGESYIGHLQPLRKCFEYGFDNIGIFSTILLPGSELESQALRDKYQIRTRYRLRQGMFGEYNGMKSIDSEEIISEHAAMSQDELTSFRLVHWLIWYGWNHGFLKPFYKYAHHIAQINPVDLILDIIRLMPSVSRLHKIQLDFNNQAAQEWFDSHQDLYAHYTSSDKWHEITNEGYTRVEFRYNSVMISNKDLFSDMLKVIYQILQDVLSNHQLEDLEMLLRLAWEMRIEPDSIFTSSLVSSKLVRLPIHLRPFLGVRDTDDYPIDEIILEKDSVQQEAVRRHLIRFGYVDRPLYAIQKTLGALPDAFSYSIKN